jgi:hypothetical protein
MTTAPKWDLPRRINIPGSLADLIRALAAAVRAGELSQIVLAGEPFATMEDIRKLPPDGPWPDYLELYFQDPHTGKRYRLMAETYHGSGGTWELVP